MLLTFLDLSPNPQHALIRDDDGTFLGGNGGSILSRAEVFSGNSFFGLPYKDAINQPGNNSFWYPNLPSTMRADKKGNVINVTFQWLTGGFGLSRAGCDLQSDWNAWRCLTSTSYRMLVIENRDADREVRRIR
jgi:hypothetical protein